jgi:hypothetical protein
MLRPAQALDPMTSDRRHSHRFPTPDDRKEATLQVGDDSFPARLVDQSSTGFAVLVDAHPGVYEGEAVWLRADGVWSKARVARVTLESKGVRVGLTRVVDQGPAEEPKLSFQLWRMPKNYRVTAIIALAVLVTVPCVLWLRYGRQSASAAAGDPFDLSSIAQSDAYQSILRLGPAVFARPEVVRHLGLSQPQLDRVRGIVLRGQQSQELARETGASADELRRIWRAAQEEARQVLTQRQQAKWDEVLRLAEQAEPNDS